MGRRIWSLAVGLALLLPGLAAAQPVYAPYDMTLSLLYRAADTAQQALYDRIYDAIWVGQEQIDLPKGTAYDDVTAVHDLLAREAPELCAVSPTWNIWYYEQTPEKASRIAVTYDRPLDTQRVLMDAARTILAGMDESEGDYARAIALHDLLCERVTYDESAEAAHTAYGALAEGRAVCDGYAGAYALLLRLSGIPCSVVTGQLLDPAEGLWSAHAWNILTLCDTPLLTDVTADDQADSVLHWYTDLPERWMSRDHAADAIAGLPECGSVAWNWHIMNGGYVPAGQAMQAMDEAFRHIARTGRPVDLRFETEEDFEAAAADVTALWERYNQRAAQEDRLYGQLSWRLSERQWCLTLSLVP